MYCLCGCWPVFCLLILSTLVSVLRLLVTMSIFVIVIGKNNATAELTYRYI